jgi:hypothetical protein
MMAFILFVTGGIAGVIAMLTSIIAFDASFVSALAIWFGTGMAVSLAGIALALAPRSDATEGQLVEA